LEALLLDATLILYTLDQVRQKHGDAAEKQHRAGIFRPAHLLGFVHAGQPVNQLFNGAQERVEESLFAIEYAGHERAQRFGDREHHQQKEQDLEPAVVCHGQNFSGRSIAYTR